MNLRVERIKWFKLLALYHLDDMVTYGALHRLAHLAYLQSVRHIFKLLERLSGAYPGQHTSFDGGLTILAQFLGKSLKIRTLCQSIVYAVNTHLSLLYLFLWCILPQHQEYVGWLYQILAPERLQHTIIVIRTLLLYHGV